MKAKKRLIKLEKQINELTKKINELNKPKSSPNVKTMGFHQLSNLQSESDEYYLFES